MSCIIPGSDANVQSLQQIYVKPSGIYTVDTAAGKKTVTLSPEQAQQYAAKQLVQSRKRGVNKFITANGTATGAGSLMLGDAFIAAGSTYVNTNATWAFQNGAAGTSAAAGLLAFQQMVKSQPFKFIGIQIDVSASALFSSLTWTEVITDYDSTNTYDWKPKVNAALNTFAQIATTRFLRVGGEFNGNWGVWINGLANGNTVNFTFNCVDIDRNW